MKKNKIRQEHCKKIMKKLGWKFVFFYVEPHKYGGTWGCYQSHMLVIEKCIKNNYEYALICEDDLTPTQFFNNKLLLKAQDFMRYNNKWDIFQFGYSLCSDKNFSDNFVFKKYSDNIYRIRACLTHCYAIQKSTYNRLYQILLKNYKPSFNHYLHIDVLYSQKTRMYGISPILFDQKWCFSSDNPANNLLENNLKKLSCFAERYRLIPNTNWYFFSKTTYYLYVVIIMMPIFLIWFIKYKKK